MIIKFWWDEDKEGFMLDITKDGGDITIEEIEELLNQYRSEYEDYDNDGWIDYLEEHGYIVRGIEYEYDLYF